MPLVFVHGVNTRDDAADRASLTVRDGYFREIALAGVVADPRTVAIESPYWGGHAARFAWSHASLPDERYEAFGAAGGIFEQIVADAASGIGADSEHLLVTTARTSLPRAVDALWAAAAFTDTAADPAPLTALARKAVQYTRANPRPAWLRRVRDDRAFTERLLDELDRWSPPADGPGGGEAAAPAAPPIESFGVSEIWDRVKAAGQQLANAAAAAAINPLAGAVRPWAHHRFSLFLGDIFAYLDRRGDRGSEGDIVKIVSAALDLAVASRAPGQDDPLVVVAHSMGGNIAYDVLSYFRPDVTCDLLLTVGSQVGVFEELKLFRSSVASVPSVAQPKVPKPANITRWLNVIDPNDPLGYAVSRIFADTTDLAFDSETHALAAHTTYFYRPHFHARLNARLLEARP